MVAYTENHARVKVIRKSFGTSVLGQDLRFYVIASRDNIDNLDAGRKDGPFWEGVRTARSPRSTGSRGVHAAGHWLDHRDAARRRGGGGRGDQPDALRARGARRLLEPAAARPDGPVPHAGPQPRRSRRAAGGVRTSAWAFDHNRDFGTQNQVENATFLPLLKRYPGLFFIDAHQQSTGYFFPPNEDPVHHEVSNFSLDFIQNRIGPALQQKFNDQSSSYRNYNTYDLFVPEYGDTVPSLLSGAAGMTFEKGTSEVYGKQVYDHYLAIDETVNVTVRDKGALSPTGRGSGRRRSTRARTARCSRTSWSAR